MNRPASDASRDVQSGFSLIELLIVLGIFGIVVGAINTLYVSHQRSATVEGEVVDVQQNLRIAMEQLTRDISMAGFLVSGSNAVAAVTNNASPTADSVTLNTATESLIGIPIDSSPGAVTLAAGNLVDVPVRMLGGSIGGFEAADVGVTKVRIANYRGESMTAGTTFTVREVNPGTDASDLLCGAVAAPCLELQADAAAAGFIERGDSIVKTSVIGGAEAFPHTVQYSVAACPAPLSGNCLMRTTVPAPTGGAQVVATNVSDLQFRYLLDGTTEVDAPTAAQMSLIRAVRVTISGQLVDTASAANGNLKTRTLMSVIAIRNA